MNAFEQTARGLLELGKALAPLALVLVLMFSLLDLALAALLPVPFGPSEYVSTAIFIVAVLRIAYWMGGRK